MLAKNSRAPRGIWFYALSFTTIATIRRFDDSTIRRFDDSTIRHASSYRAKALRI
jgi:hypothetical protein